MWKIFVVLFLIVQAVLSCKSSKDEDSNEVEETKVNKGTKNENEQLPSKLKIHSLKSMKLPNSKEFPSYCGVQVVQ